MEINIIIIIIIVEMISGFDILQSFRTRSIKIICLLAHAFAFNKA